MKHIKQAFTGLGTVLLGILSVFVCLAILGLIVFIIGFPIAYFVGADNGYTISFIILVLLGVGYCVGDDLF